MQPVNSLDDIASWDDEWKQHYAWVLVGGQKLDRGFTIEGLTVTYMPRGKGVGYADTIQQRGRFFGYKLNYLDLCRIYLEPDVRSAFEVYVASEESMRSFLRANGGVGALKRPGLKRQFQMDRSLRPTRRSILVDVPVNRRLSTRGWFAQRRPHASPENADENRRLIDGFVASRGLKPRLADDVSAWLRAPGQARPTHLHRVIHGLTAAELYELLSALVMAHESDELKWQVALALVENVALQSPTSPAAIVWIRPALRSARGTTQSRGYPPVVHGRLPQEVGDGLRGRRRGASGEADATGTRVRHPYRQGVGRPACLAKGEYPCAVAISGIQPGLHHTEPARGLSVMLP